jgi:putative ABC transport system permease protein
MVSMLDRKLLRDLGELRGQIITISLVMACGLATYVGSVSTYDSLVGARDRFYVASRFADLFADLRRAPRSVEARLREIPGVGAAETRVVSEVVLDMPLLDEPVVGRFYSLPRDLNRLHLRTGRYPERRDEVIVSEAFAKAHRLHPGDGVAGVINGRRELFRVTGTALSAEFIYALRGVAPMPDNLRFGVFWATDAAMAAAMGMQGAFNSVVVRFAPGASPQAVLERVDDVLRPYGGGGAYLRKDQSSEMFVANEMNQLRTMAVIIPVIFLGVAVFLLQIVISRLVHAQQQQIAVLKGVGYSNAEVQLHYLKLVTSIALFGAAGGIALGIWLGDAMTVLYEDFFKFPDLTYRLGYSLPVQAVLIATATAVISAVTAVRWVAALPPAEAMRPPSPGLFHRGILDRIGVTRLLAPVGRMTVRSLSRRPLRAALATAGVALSVAMVMLSSFWTDAINVIIDEQYGRADRSNASVVFLAPVDQSVLSELSAVDGVLDAEGSRAVGVRVRAGPRSVATALTGLAQEQRLRRYYDAAGKLIAIPESDLALSVILAERLGVRPGDMVVIEVLEGLRPTAILRVGAVVNEALGFAAYLSTGALGRLLKEPVRYNSAFLQVDPAKFGAVYRTVKQMPMVVAVNSKAVMLKSFRATIESLILVMVAFLVVFSTIIAFGIVYNTLRISLTERGWELASLRVLGFTRGEVVRMFLGEAAVEIALAIPIGFAAGYGLAKLVISLMMSDIMRMPLVIAPSTYTWSALAVVAAGIASGLALKRNIDELDLVEVLKSRE